MPQQLQEITLIQILSASEVCKALSLGKTSLYAKIDPESPYYDPSFPKPIHLGGGRRIGWRLGAIKEWLDAQAPATPEQRKQKAQPLNQGRKRRREALAAVA